MRVTLWSPTDKPSFDTATPMPHASGRSPRGGDRHVPNHPSSGALCVKLSGLTSSIPNGVTGRAAAISRTRSVKKCLSTLSSSGIRWMSLFIVLLCYEQSAALLWQRLPSNPPCLYFKRIRSCRTHQVETLEEAIVMVQTTPDRVAYA